VKHQMAKQMVLFSVIGTMVAMAFMASSIIFPHPLLLVLAMSIGQGIAIFALALFLLAVALDLQSSGVSYIPIDEPVPETGPEAGTGAGSETPPAPPAP
jgi:hypothetical protein